MENSHCTSVHADSVNNVMRVTQYQSHWLEINGMWETSYSQCSSVKFTLCYLPYKGDTSMVFNRFQEIEQDEVIVLSKIT